MAESTRAHMEAAASLIGCLADDLLAFRWSEEEHLFIVLAPTGQKHRFELDQIEAQIFKTAAAAVTVTPAPTAPDPDLKPELAGTDISQAAARKYQTPAPPGAADPVHPVHPVKVPPRRKVKP